MQSTDTLHPFTLSSFVQQKETCWACPVFEDYSVYWIIVAHINGVFQVLKVDGLEKEPFNVTSFGSFLSFKDAADCARSYVHMHFWTSEEVVKTFLTIMGDVE